MKKLVWLIGLFSFALLSAQVQSADFYEGKTLRIVVAYSPGGGYDTYARLVARYFGKHIPGAPRMIVENRPGAGGLIAANYLYNAPKQTGINVLHVGGSTVIKQLTGSPNVKYDMGRFQYVGAPDTQESVLVVTKGSGVTNVEQVLGKDGKQLALGGISTGSPTDVAAILLRDVLGGNVKLVTGYQGTANIRLAIGQGELNGMFNSWSSLKSTNFAELQSGEWLVLLQVSERPIPDLQGDVPLMQSLAKTPDQRQLIRLTTLVPYQFARPFLVGPQVPAEHVETLRETFQKTMADPEFLAEAKKAHLEINPVDGKKLAASVDEFLNMAPEVQAKVVELLVQ